MMSEKSDPRVSWTCDKYLGHIATMLNINMLYLHSSVTWTVTVFLGAIGFLLSRGKFSEIQDLLVCCLLLVIICQFSIRAAKAYMNVVRFTTIERLIIGTQLVPTNESRWPDVYRQITSFHCEWRCPLAFKAITAHILLRLGFVYFYGVSAALAGYCVYQIGLDAQVAITMMSTVGIMIVEIYYGFCKSDYVTGRSPGTLLPELTQPPRAIPDVPPETKG